MTEITDMLRPACTLLFRKQLTGAWTGAEDKRRQAWQTGREEKVRGKHRDVETLGTVDNTEKGGQISERRDGGDLREERSMCYLFHTGTLQSTRKDAILGRQDWEKTPRGDGSRELCDY